jgi:hypothetical protein
MSRPDNIPSSSTPIIMPMTAPGVTAAPPDSDSSAELSVSIVTFLGLGTSKTLLAVISPAYFMYSGRPEPALNPLNRVSESSDMLCKRILVNSS